MGETTSYIKPLVALFEGPLAEVRFADLDGQALTRGVAEVAVAEEDLNAAQAVVDAARAKLTERQEALLQAAHRALAYARVYAEPDEALSAQVNAIALPRPVRKPRSGAADALVLSPDPAPAAREGSRPRGRPRKHPLPEANGEMLAPMVE